MIALNLTYNTLSLQDFHSLFTVNSKLIVKDFIRLIVKKNILIMNYVI